MKTDQTKETGNQSEVTPPLRRGRILPGIILITLGAIFLLNNYGITVIDIGRLWPLFLIIIGIFILTGSSRRN